MANMKTNGVWFEQIDRQLLKIDRLMGRDTQIDGQVIRSIGIRQKGRQKDRDKERKIDSL